MGHLVVGLSSVTAAPTLAGAGDVQLLKDGVLLMKETSTPTADPDYAKLYSNSNNRLYIQTGDGVEQQIRTSHQSITINADVKTLFRDAAIGIYSQADTFMDLFADGAVRIGDSSAGAPSSYSKFGPSGHLTLPAGAAAAGSAPLKFTTGTALGTPEAGALEYHDSRLYLTNVATQRSLDRTSDVAVSTVTVANTVTETTMWTGTMPANSLVAGNMFKFHADGVVSNGGSAAAADQITIRIKVGATTVVTLTPATKALSSDHWHLDANACQRTIGGSGSRAVHVDLVIDDVETELIGVATIDTTASMDVTVTAQWGSAKAANTISLYQGYMEYKN